MLLVVLVIYFPAISGEVNTVDDVHIISAYGINGHLTLKDIFLPAGQFYFRPLVELTYFIDNLCWGLDASFMHLENILFHALNVILVYFIATRVSVMLGDLPALPFVSSLLFALHPINVEAVSWIAGRTDSLAASFILCSTFLLLTGIKPARISYLLLSLVALILSLFVKETSVVLLPASLLFVVSLPKSGDAMRDDDRNLDTRLIWIYLLMMALISFFIAFRLFLKPSGSDNAFSMVMLKNYNTIELLSLSMKAMGFYLKKLFFPYPLNFAIHTVSDWYLPLGAVVPLFCLYMMSKRDLLSSFSVVGLLFTVPAIVAGAAGINWTPFAERYLYIPTAFLSIGVSGLILTSASSMKRECRVYQCLGLLAIPVAFTTFERNLLWRDNLALYRDAAEKSPGFGDIHNELGVALLRNGQSSEATQHFSLAEKLSTRPLIREFARMNLLYTALQGKTLYEKKNILHDFVDEHRQASPEVVKMLRGVVMEILQTEKDMDRRVLLIKEAIALNDRLYREVEDSFYLYCNGRLMLALGNHSAGLDYFRKTVISAPMGAYYLQPAQKLVEGLENNE